MDFLNGVSSASPTMFSNSINQKKTEDKSGLGVDDFLQLIAAQMRNQDMMNPMNDTEFIGQLAQFTSLQAINTLTSLNATTYSVGLLGKEVTVARMLNNGNLFTETGVVTGIGLFDGDPIIYIGEKAYSLSEIMAVGKIPEVAEQNPTPEGGTSEPEPSAEPEDDGAEG